MFEEVELSSDDEGSKIPRKTKVTTRKRKSPDSDEDKQTLRHTARGLCRDLEEWKLVKKYTLPKLRDWIENRKFEVDRSVGETVIKRGVQVASFALDTVLQGEGYICSEISEDEELLRCVQAEIGHLLKFLNNRFRIAFLLANDVWTGHIKKPKRETPFIIEAEEEKENTDGTQSTTAINRQGQHSGISEVDPVVFTDYSCAQEEREEEESSGSLAKTKGGISLAPDGTDGRLLAFDREEGEWENDTYSEALERSP